jgi:putative transposase
VEGLNVSGMSRGNLAKQILDCSWSEWFRQLRYKAAEAGRRLVAVDPKYTSQICSQCGFKHPDNRKTQADFACLLCGYQDNADHNAAVLLKGMSSEKHFSLPERQKYFPASSPLAIVPTLLL